MAWKGTTCMEWDCGWFGKVPGVWNVLLLVAGVQIGTMDGLKRYLVYRMGLWKVRKGARSMKWFVVGSRCT
jgi:hypothetical protein